MTAAATLERARRVVVKVGSALLVDAAGEPRLPWLQSLAEDVSVWHCRGAQIIIVTSGSIALGRRILGLPGRVLKLEEKQAAAAAGQIRLARAYQECLGEVGLRTAQILVTLSDTEARRRYLNARATMETLIRLGVVPVVNENDTVATSEIRYGDNDRLSARVAVMNSAELLILLSDVDGLYAADPRIDRTARHLPEVPSINAEIEAMAGGSGSAHGTGGMVSKLAAAKIATSAGCAVILGDGKSLRPLHALDDGARCTYFGAATTPRGARKHWIAASLGVMGSIRIDDGAKAALKRGSSLLPAGVVAISGQFERGDAILIEDQSGVGIAKGLSAYDAVDAVAIAGRRSQEIESILGFRGRDAMIHRDDLVLL
ncbi:MAG: glutamate 5-kinase [Pseudomonadota bacterium]